MVRFGFVLCSLLCILGVDPAGGAQGQKAKDFKVWLGEFRKEALAAGVSSKTLDLALKDVTPLARVIELDRKQPEFTLSLEEYMSRVVSEARVARGREAWVRHRELVEAIAEQYGVPPQYLMALWGMESSYGSSPGDFPVIGSLVTLAYDGRRGAYFRKELVLALRILDKGHVSLQRMTGSWAGAMGNFQFMPSSFWSYATDYNGDGRMDIWGDLGDSIASAANYLSKLGWKREQGWGREVRIQEGFDRSLVGSQVRKSLGEWQALGVMGPDGEELRDPPSWTAALIQPDGAQGRAFLTYDNYRAIMSWNRSHLFAISVGTLADRIAAE
jgi:membrane-bound lytic murein transglycosylase B